MVFYLLLIFSILCHNSGYGSTKLAWQLLAIARSLCLLGLAKMCVSVLCNLQVCECVCVWYQ